MPEQPVWHATDIAEVARRLDVDASIGLDQAEVEVRRRHHGPNQLEDEPPISPLILVLRQFRSPLIYILLVAAIVTIVLEEYIDAAVIAAVLVLNAVIGFTQERKAEGAVRALMGLVVPQSRVVRGEVEYDIDSRDLVPGDLVVLEPGTRVPADLRLVATTALQIDESLLTGESLPVNKHPRPVDVGAVLADRRNMAYTGALVTSGRGRGLVVATGGRTELGSIADLVRSETITATPLQQRMGRFAGVIGVVVGVAALVAFVSGRLLGGESGEMFLTAVALAVAAIPEGLPVVFTITLALGVRRMAHRNAIIRRLPAVETLGSTTVIGSDKTGTLTENRMTVRSITVLTPEGPIRHELRTSDPLSGFVPAVAGPPAARSPGPALSATLLGGLLANEAEISADGHRWTGDPTEVALLRSAMGAGLEVEIERRAHPRFAEIPFESERRYAAVFVADPDGRRMVHVKGAPERVAEMCASTLLDDGTVVAIDVDLVHQIAHDMAAEGLRVLAVAQGEAPVVDDPEHPPEPQQLVLVGLQGMLDPPRAGVYDAIATCRHAGIRVAMITGDHAVTARAIAADLGIAGSDDEVLTGVDLAGLGDDELRGRVGSVSVYARVAPEEKLRIVEALQARGEVVAVTGDGVNDAPALRAAAIGIAMGRDGTDVAREAADMVLTDDNFVSIAAAVEEGRVTFDNVRKVTFFLVSTGIGTIIAILVGVWLQWPLLMLPAQLLWLNLVTNGLQDVALAFEPGERGVLDRRPRRTSEGILSARSWQRAALAGSVMAIGTLLLFRWELDRSDSLPTAQTVALTTMVVFMAFHAGNSRSELRSVFQVDPRSNPFLLIATVAAVGVHIAALYFPPTQYVLRVEPLDLESWMRIVPVATTVVVAMEFDKLVRRSRSARSGSGRPVSAATGSAASGSAASRPVVGPGR